MNVNSCTAPGVFRANDRDCTNPAAACNALGVVILTPGHLFSHAERALFNSLPDPTTLQLSTGTTAPAVISFDPIRPFSRKIVRANYTTAVSGCAQSRLLKQQALSTIYAQGIMLVS